MSMGLDSLQRTTAITQSRQKIVNCQTPDSATWCIAWFCAFCGLCEEAFCSCETEIFFDYPSSFEFLQRVIQSVHVFFSACKVGRVICNPLTHMATSIRVVEVLQEVHMHRCQAGVLDH